ncbi:protein translocase subunit SecF, partial [Treponema sp.]|uniref:protein translocase subunit SecF n=1 Tax=Treponema sp. TaxID=166 RepID=UPI00298E4E0D
LAGTMLCIWAYATIRFRWDFALGAIIALIHDTLIMFSFLAIFQVEFSTTSIAAVLTIIGYSINDTVVILDRVRDNIQKLEVKKFNEVLNQSLSDTLSRSLITTITTLFAVVSLYVFTTGSIKDFAWALIIGLLSGCYSSLFISSGFISFVRRNWKPEYGLHATTPREVSAQV